MQEINRIVTNVTYFYSVKLFREYLYNFVFKTWISSIQYNVRCLRIVVFQLVVGKYGSQTNYFSRQSPGKR